MTNREIGQALKRAQRDGWRATGRHTLRREVEPGVKECAPTMVVAKLYASASPTTRTNLEALGATL